MNESPPPQPAPHHPFGQRGWAPLALSLIAFAAAILIFRTADPPPARAITLTAGAENTTRSVVARALADQIGARGVATTVLPSGGTLARLQLVDSGAVDFALVSGALRADRYTHVREVAPLYTEALHLMVKGELAEAVGRGLAALRGHSVNLGPEGSSTDGLAKTVLALAGISALEAPGRGDILPRHEDPAESLVALNRRTRDSLPDAVFELATLPSTIVLRYVRQANYRLVAVPFADAFRLSALIAQDDEPSADEEVERLYTVDTVIPAYTYRIEPPVPETPLHTLGVPLLMVANEGVSAETVERVLEAVFDSRFARMHQPPLEHSLLALPARMPLHPGAISFRQRDKPLLTQDDVETLSDSLSVLGALMGGGLFLWQAWRQQRQSRREELFGAYLIRVADIERGIAELELASNIDLESLISLQRDLLQLKAAALQDFTAGTLGSQAALFDLLGPINSARDQIAQLLLHVRETIEARAESQGRMPEELWEEAAETPAEP